MDSIKIYNAHKDDLPWVNEHYSSIGFLHSSLNKEKIVIAEYKGQKCGLGRLIYINDDNVELSGIYVFEAFRKKGVAHKIVRFLLDGIAGRQLTVWCIPFVYLKHLYESFGLKSATVNMKAPLAITKKLDWCHKNYDAEVVLLYKHI